MRLIIFPGITYVKNWKKRLPNHEDHRFYIFICVSTQFITHLFLFSSIELYMANILYGRYVYSISNWSIYIPFTIWQKNNYYYNWIKPPKNSWKITNLKNNRSTSIKRIQHKTKKKRILIFFVVFLLDFLRLCCYC